MTLRGYSGLSSSVRTRFVAGSVVVAEARMLRVRMYDSISAWEMVDCSGSMRARLAAWSLSASGCSNSTDDEIGRSVSAGDVVGRDRLRGVGRLGVAFCSESLGASQTRHLSEISQERTLVVREPPTFLE